MPDPLPDPMPDSTPDSMPTGFDRRFLSFVVDLPTPDRPTAEDLVTLEGSPHLHYMHFTVALSRSRRLARYVAWNIDGRTLFPGDTMSRAGLAFRLDPRLPATTQIGDSVYSRNPLDRGHLARRADLLWGRLADAQRANADSFFFTNITPQMEAFNQSGRGGIWGLLENALLDQSALDRRRISLFGGPVLGEQDRTYRGVRIPVAFWKVIAYSLNRRPRVRAFLLTQDLGPLPDEHPALTGETRGGAGVLGDIDLDAFVTYEQSLEEITARTGLHFGRLTARQAPRPTLRAGVPRRPLRTVEDLDW